MAVYKRKDTDKMLKAVEQGKTSALYLLIGERFLCGQVADQLIDVLIPDPDMRQRCVKLVDGDEENLAETLAFLKTYSLFSGKQVIRVSDTRLFHSKAVAKKIWKSAQKAFSKKDSKSALKYLQQLADLARQNPEDLAGLSPANWQKAFSFAKPPEITWINEVTEASVDGSLQGGDQAPENDPAQLFMEAFSSGIPENNTLLLLAETVDKRKKFYKFISEHGIVADLSVATGSSTAARSDQESVLRSLVHNTLAEFDKKIESQAVAELLERIGFHPVAVVRETEKLALYAGTGPTITVQSVRELVGRTREDALYELTEAYSERQLNTSLLLTQRLFNEGVHPLVMVSALRNHLKKLLLVRSIRETAPPSYIPGMNYMMFQKGYLPELKAAKEEWLGLLPTHPYALFLMFEKADSYSLSSLAAKMTELLTVEYSLKSSSIAPQIFFERFLWNTLTDK